MDVLSKMQDALDQLDNYGAINKLDVHKEILWLDARFNLVEAMAETRKLLTE